MNLLNLPEPILTPVPGYDNLMALTQPFAVSVCGLTVTVRTGFQTDGGSIPAICWPIVGNPWDGKCLTGYVIHDALYSTHHTDRETADECLDVLLKRYGVCRLRSGTIWSAVRAFGWCAWSRTPAQVAEARRLVTVAK